MSHAPKAKSFNLGKSLNRVKAEEMKRLLIRKLVFVGLFYLSLGLVLTACGEGGGGGAPIVYILTVNKT